MSQIPIPKRPTASIRASLAAILLIASPLVFSGETTNKIGITMIDIPAGSFMMGSCKAEESQSQSQSARSAPVDSCKKYYSGYAGNIEFVSYDGNYYGNFIVIGSGNGNVTIKGVLGPNWRNGGNFPGLDRVESMSCSRLMNIER